MYRADNSLASDPVIIGFPALIKAHVDGAGRRLIELEVSNEYEDVEGDLIQQKALLKAASTYLRTGHVDIDHYSELGKNPAYKWLGIKNPEEWIIGMPTTVRDIGDSRTGIEAEIYKNKDGTVDPTRYKYDMFWQSLQTDPPARWYASIYGYPGNDTEEGTLATRYLVKSFDWRSTAVTRNPVNDSIKSAARIVSAKSFAAKLPRPFPADEQVFTREHMRQLFKSHICGECPSTDKGQDVTVWSIRDHFMKCDHLTYNMADLYALAISELMSRRF